MGKFLQAIKSIFIVKIVAVNYYFVHCSSSSYVNKIATVVLLPSLSLACVVMEANLHLSMGTAEYRNKPIKYHWSFPSVAMATKVLQLVLVIIVNTIGSMAVILEVEYC